MKQSTLAIIGAPLDMGSDRRGVDMGPSALRMAGLNRRLAALGYEVEDMGNVMVEQQESLPEGPRHAKYLPQIAAVCERIGDAVTQAAVDGKAPLVLGGDHSIAIGTVSGMAKALRKKRHKMGVVWLDAHADMNTPQSSPSGNVHGMALACLIGLGPPELTKLYGFVPKVDPRNVVLMGVREVDILERPQVRESGVTVFTMRDIDEKGMRWVTEQAIEVASRGTVGYHLSLDMDCVDPQYAPGVGTPVPGGATYREAHLAMEMMADSGGIISMEVVEVNPVFDEANRTADLAVQLVLSALGKKILG